MGTHRYGYLLTHATLGRTFMQPKTWNSVEIGKNLAVDFLCDFGYITLSLTHSSTRRERSKSSACLQLVATGSGICQGLDHHRDGEC